MKYIGVVGSRRRATRADFSLVRQTILDHWQTGDVIVSGGCKTGADAFAEEVCAKDLGIDPLIFYPDKSALNPELLKKNPRAAYTIINYARNTFIAGRSDILIACVAPDRKGGTEDTIKKFEKRTGEKVILI